MLIRYDVENISDEVFDKACKTVFAEPPVDDLYLENFESAEGSHIFSVEFLPGQFDQRADSAVQCVQFLDENAQPIIRSATTYVIEGTITDEEFDAIKHHCINPVDSRETGLQKPETLVTVFPEPEDVKIFDGFKEMPEAELKALYDSLNLAMTFKDFQHIQHYFNGEEKRDPSMTEIRVLDTYWSDHCRHTTFSTELTDIGMSGAGKSTLVRCMNFLEVPTEGRVFIDGKSLGDFSEKELRKQREEIGMIFQHFNLLMQKSVIDNVCFPLYIKGKKKAEARKRAAELLDIVGLGDRQNAYPAQLSGGQKQRVAIARALASDPKILLCDEATSALDPQTTSSILELLKEINKQFGITIVIITHQMSVVREICTHVAIMYEGEVVEKGLVADIFADPQSEVAKELIRKDSGSDIDAETDKAQTEIKSGEKIRIVFSENSAFEPVIANLILTFKEPVNILKADTKNVGGVAKGEMILEFMKGSTNTEQMKKYLTDRGLTIGEVTEYVG